MNNNPTRMLVITVLASIIVAVPLWRIAGALEQQNKLIEQSNAAPTRSLEFPRAVMPYELEPELKICFEGSSPEQHRSYTVASDVYEMPRGEDKGGVMPVVELESLDGESTILTLAELGILPYPSGTWGEGRTFLGFCSSGG